MDLKDLSWMSRIGLGASCFCLLAALSSGASRAQTLTVNTRTPIRTLLGTAFGVNLFYWGDNHASLSYFKEAGFKSVRYPGGANSDVFDWTTTNATQPWPTFVADMASAGVLGKNIILTCNYGKEGTPAMAAAWVRDANVSRKMGIRYWELGNEEWDNTDPVKYAHDYVRWSAAMKAVDPSLKLGAIVTNVWGKYAKEAVTNPRTHQQEIGWTPVLLSTLYSLGVTPDFLIEHQYQYGPGTEDDAKLLSGLDAGGWTLDYVANGQIRAMLKDYLPGAARVQLLQTEVGTVWGNPGKQNVNLPGGLAMAVMVGDSLKTEYRATDWWLWQDNYVNTDPKQFNMNPSLYGWRLYGHYGLARFDPKLGRLDRHPVFYIAKMLNKFISDGDKVYECTSTDPLLKIYAARHAGGPLSVLVVNTAPNKDYRNVPIKLIGFKAQGVATVWTYGKANDDAARDGRPGQDLTQSTQPVSGPTITRSFPQYSATLMTFSREATAAP